METVKLSSRGQVLPRALRDAIEWSLKGNFQGPPVTIEEMEKGIARGRGGAMLAVDTDVVVRLLMDDDAGQTRRMRG